MQSFEYNNNLIEYIPPNIERILNRITNHQNIYSDSQNVHNHDIQKCITKSIQNIILIKPTIINLNEYILNDDIFTKETKEILIEYSNDTSIHSILNITFSELLIAVLSRIDINNHKNEIKNILNIEMNDSVCKCFTGRMSRLINCLNGFDDLVEIKISDKEQIGNIIVVIRNKLIKKNTYSIDLHKEQAKKELTELQYSDDIINEYLEYIE